MSRLQETVNLKINPGTVSARIEDTLNRAKERGRGLASAASKRWYVGGFMLEELGGGLLDALIGMETRGELDTMSTEQKRRLVVRMLGVDMPEPIPAPVVVREAEPTPVQSGMQNYGV